MEEHPNAAVARRMCKALRLADEAGIEEVFAEGALLQVIGQNLISGLYAGREEIVKFATRRRELSGGRLRAVLHDVVASDSHTFVVERFMAKRGDRKLDVKNVTVLHVTDGKVVGAAMLSGAPYKEDEFWC